MFLGVCLATREIRKLCAVRRETQSARSSCQHVFAGNAAHGRKHSQQHNNTQHTHPSLMASP